MHTTAWLEYQTGWDHSEDLGKDGEDNIRMDLRVIGWEGVDWMHLAQDRSQWQDLVNITMNL
jgi:hypothetical protein